MHHSHSITIDTNAKFELEYAKKIQLILMTEPFFRGPAHAMRDDTTAYTHELLHVSEAFSVDKHPGAWAEVIRPNLPWAEDHFQERVGGEPLNPAPSEAWWPYARQGNAEHKKDQVFSHTYPERFWPRVANGGGKIQHSTRGVNGVPHVGIRFEYGDLWDIVNVLDKNPRSRQAYLPIWFPEDINAANVGERVPCSLGYHFLLNPSTQRMDITYYLRSCDLVRFYRDDMYMAGRLLQWVCHRLKDEFLPGKLVVNIANLHCFPGDRPLLESMVPKTSLSQDVRASYNFGAMG